MYHIVSNPPTYINIPPATVSANSHNGTVPFIIYRMSVINIAISSIDPIVTTIFDSFFILERLFRYRGLFLKGRGLLRLS